MGGIWTAEPAASTTWFYNYNVDFTTVTEQIYLFFDDEKGVKGDDAAAIGWVQPQRRLETNQKFICSQHSSPLMDFHQMQV